MIEAKHKDGTPVRVGEKVLAVWDNGFKRYGHISRVGQPMRFTEYNFQELQTYDIRCTGGLTRPAHARHIKFALPSFRRRKDAP